MSKVCLIVLCGLPASGKTTFVKKFKKFLNDNVKQNWKPVHICYDELMPTEIDEKIFKNESENLTSVWKSYRLAILNCIKYFVEQLQKGSIKNIPINQNMNFNKPLNDDKQRKIKERFYIIQTTFNDKVINNAKEVHDTDINWLLIIDDNMWLQSMRYQVCQLARKYKCSFSQIYFHASPDTCLRRNSLRDDANKISEDTILRMSERMEAPSLTSGWERFSTTWSDDDDDRQRNYTKIVNLLTESFNHPCLDPNEVDLLSNQSESSASLSTIHQSDVILRKAVTKWVTLIKGKCSKDDLAEKVKSINFVKGDLLGRLRLGTLVLPPMGEVMGSNGESELCEYLSHLFDEEMTKILGMD